MIALQDLEKLHMSGQMGICLMLLLSLHFKGEDDYASLQLLLILI